VERIVLMTHTLRRADLPENGVVAFEIAGDGYLVTDIEGEVRAFAVIGPAVQALGRAVVAEGRLRCPLHGWPIDPHIGRCGAADLCRYDPMPVEVEGEQIHVGLRSPEEREARGLPRC
jgi:nitrite reductase/ring-hydroxylating ferredoxin subunit